MPYSKKSKKNTPNKRLLHESNRTQRSMRKVEKGNLLRAVLMLRAEEDYKRAKREEEQKKKSKKKLLIFVHHHRVNNLGRQWKRQETCHSKKIRINTQQHQPIIIIIIL